MVRAWTFLGNSAVSPRVCQEEEGLCSLLRSLGLTPHWMSTLRACKVAGHELVRSREHAPSSAVSQAIQPSSFSFREGADSLEQTWRQMLECTQHIGEAIAVRDTYT